MADIEYNDINLSGIKMKGTFVDNIVSRENMKEMLSNLIGLLVS